MNEIIPRYREGRPLPKGYNDSPDSYKSLEPSDINIRNRIMYAKASNRNILDLTYDEVQPFMERSVR